MFVLYCYLKIILFLKVFGLLIIMSSSCSFFELVTPIELD
jgi:hypothetical protein